MHSVRMDVVRSYETASVSETHSTKFDLGLRWHRRIPAHTRTRLTRAKSQLLDTGDSTGENRAPECAKSHVAARISGEWNFRLSRASSFARVGVKNILETLLRGLFFPSPQITPAQSGGGRVNRALAKELQL